MIEALDTTGPAAQAARYEGSYMNPHDALGRLIEARPLAAVAR